LEEINMRNIFKTLVLSAAFCATAAFAANQARVDVPFSFTAKGTSYPAGSYAVSIDSTQHVVTMVSYTNPTKQISWNAGPGETIKAPAMVRFDVIGAEYSLKNIQVGSRVTPNLDRHNKRGISATTSIAGE
jgi:hypothetical protein